MSVHFHFCQSCCDCDWVGARVRVRGLRLGGLVEGFICIILTWCRVFARFFDSYNLKNATVAQSYFFLLTLCLMVQPKPVKDGYSS